MIVPRGPGPIAIAIQSVVLLASVLLARRSDNNHPNTDAEKNSKQGGEK